MAHVSQAALPTCRTSLDGVGPCLHRTLLAADKIHQLCQDSRFFTSRTVLEDSAPSTVRHDDITAPDVVASASDRDVVTIPTHGPLARALNPSDSDSLSIITIPHALDLDTYRREPTLQALAPLTIGIQHFAENGVR